MIIAASSAPHTPLIWSEFNASYANEPDVTDAPYMGPWLADTIRQCDGLVDMMSYWSFSDVFDEQGIPKTPFYGGFGLIAPDGIPKAAYSAFALLHKTGDQRVNLDSTNALLTKRADGSLVLVVWNYAPPEKAGESATFTIHLRNVQPKRATISRVDSAHGDPRSTFRELGSPASPTQEQIRKMQQAAQLSAPEVQQIKNGTLSLTLPTYGLAVIELK